VDVACVGKIEAIDFASASDFACHHFRIHPWNSLLVPKVVQNIYSSQFIAHRFGTGFSHLLGNRSGRENESDLQNSAAKASNHDFGHLTAVHWQSN
jgi:hypothetical protein